MLAIVHSLWCPYDLGKNVLKPAVRVQTTQTMSAPTTYSSAQSSTTPSNALGALGGALEALGRRHLA